MRNEISIRRLTVRAGAVGAAKLTWRDVVAAFYAENSRQPAGQFYHPFKSMLVDNDLLHWDVKNNPPAGTSSISLDAFAIKPVNQSRVTGWKSGRTMHNADTVTRATKTLT